MRVGVLAMVAVREMVARVLVCVVGKVCWRVRVLVGLVSVWAAVRDGARDGDVGARVCAGGGS